MQFPRARNRLVSVIPSVGLIAGCASGGTSPFDKTFVAVVYGEVTRNGSPVPSLNVKGDVFVTTCPSSPLQQTSTQSTQTGADGPYRLLLTSSDQDAGQCLVLTAEGAQPVLQTLEVPFTQEFPGPPTDSVQINLTVP
jgi:hypothetical protein